jgi:hypothetical protein
VITTLVKAVLDFALGLTSTSLLVLIATIIAAAVAVIVV